MGQALNPFDSTIEIVDLRERLRALINDLYPGKPGPKPPIPTVIDQPASQQMRLDIETLSALEQLKQRLDVIAEKVGWHSDTLGLRAALHGIFTDARMSGIDRHTLEAAVQEQLDITYRDPSKRD